MPTLSTSVSCPVCSRAMMTRVMACPDCGVRIEGNFKENEFARLEEDWLHFLRIFIHCEGRIRDMEAALGISYPTVKARIAELKQKLGTVDSRPGTEDAVPGTEDAPPETNFTDVLDLLESGDIDYDEAMKRLKR